MKKELIKAENYDAENVERPAGLRWVTMSNALARAGQGLTLSEKRIVMIAVSKLDSFRPQNPADVPVTRITAAEYVEAYQVDVNTAYDQLQAAAKVLYNRSITFYEAAHKRKGKALVPTVVKMRWVGEAKYQKNEGWIELAWWPKLLPYLINLRKQFTKYQLQQASALRSIYSWRLLEILTRFQSTGVADYTIEDFCQAMDAPEKHLLNFAKVREKIIEPAVKELTQKDGWIIQWEAIKAGRKVAKLRFRFARNPQQSLF
jgi:plasmid replication initiation protein